MAQSTSISPVSLDQHWSESTHQQQKPVVEADVTNEHETNRKNHLLLTMNMPLETEVSFLDLHCSSTTHHMPATEHNNNIQGKGTEKIHSTAV